nr:hypothetical protein [Tanacetum cinerariifolium]
MFVGLKRSKLERELDLNWVRLSRSRSMLETDLDRLSSTRSRSLGWSRSKHAGVGPDLVRAFQVIADVPEIYKQEFWATAKLHHNSIRFKIDTKKSVLDLEAFREMLHISPRIPNQSFADLPNEEEILDFLRFTKVIIDYFMTRKPSISKRNRINWHYARDDVLFSTIKVVLRHQTTQQYSAILPIELTTNEIRNSKAYKEYYACAMGEATPKPKASARKKKGESASSTTPPTPTPTTTIESAPRLSAIAKGKQPSRATTPIEPTDIDTKKSVLDLEAFREMLHISPRIPNQCFADLPTEEEILDFLRSFASVINKCLTGKSSGVDSFRLSQAQMLWGFYHRINIDFAYIIWEDFVYQVEHKNQKRSNEMYYPRFMKVIIDYFMTRKPSISRRNRINWHYVRDDVLFSTIKVVSRHQTTQQYGAILPIKLTTDEIKNSKAYKEYYACAMGEAAP